MKSDDDTNIVKASPSYYNEYPIPRALVKSFFIRSLALVTYYVLFVTIMAIVIFSLMCYFNIRILSGKTTDLIIVSFLLALIISVIPRRDVLSPSLPGKVFMAIYKRFGVADEYLDLNGTLTFAVLPIVKWIEKNVKCPSCGRKIKRVEYHLLTKSLFKFDIWCDKCGYKELKTGTFDTVLKFSIPIDKLPSLSKASHFDILDAICNGKITEGDIWREISEDEAPSALKKMVEEVKKHFTVTQVTYRYKNKKFEEIFYPPLSIYPFFIYWDKFAICKIDDTLINEILVSRREILFLNYNYTGEYISIEYSPQSKRFIDLRSEESEGTKITDTARRLYVMLNNDRELREKLKSYMKDNLFIGSRKRRLSFEELREYLLRYRPEYSLAETEFFEKEKEAIVGVHIFTAYSPTRDKIKLRPEYFDIARRILEYVLSD
ncbi:MAG: hypothetical protein DRN18_02490 [Thermoplasmata archaeon]|nr:MAG: hypothetical protein DRN18_02490 [Thermoplasmata archaeon]